MPENPSDLLPEITKMLRFATQPKIDATSAGRYFAAARTLVLTFAIQNGYTPADLQSMIAIITAAG
jgi:hypothetical protein